MTPKILFAHFKLLYLMLVRQPDFWGPTVILPCLLYAMFGAGLGAGGQAAAYAVVSFSVYGVAGVTFFQFGSSLAQYRESGFAVWQTLLPLSQIAGWVSQIIIAMLFSKVALLLVVLTGIFLGGYEPDVIDVIALLLTCIVIEVPAAMMGILLSLSVSGFSAAALGMLIYLPLAYLGGLWIPPELLPEAINVISWFTPTRHMIEFVWSAYILNTERILISFALLLLDTAILTALCVWRRSRLITN